MMLTAGSLFSGLGGIDLAIERAGFEVRWQVENDPDCNRVLAHHWPGVKRFGDVREVDCGKLEPVDLIVGGWPCQGNSVAGQRGGMADPRSGLFSEVVRIARALSPRWLVLENVPGLRSVNKGRDMGIVLRALGELGFWWAYRSLDAQYFNVPQRRERVFFVCDSRDPGGPVKVLFESESCCGNLEESREAGQDVAASLTSGSHGAGVSEPGRRREDDVNLAYQCQGTNVGEMGTLRRGNGHVTGGVPFVFDERNVTSKANRSTMHLDGPALSLHEAGSMTVAHTLSAARASEDGTGRGVPIVPVGFSNRGLPTAAGAERLRAGSHGALPMVGQGMAVRRLMPVECLRLMGLPDDWLDVIPALSDSVKYRLVGNSVAVPCVEWIARRLAAMEA